MGYIQRVNLLAALQKMTEVSASFPQSITGSSLSKDEIIRELLKAKQDPDFKEELKDYFMCEVLHGCNQDMDYGEDDEDDEEKWRSVKKGLSAKFKKFTSLFKPTFQNGKLIVWRKLVLGSRELDYDGLGVYWTWDADYAHSHWGEYNCGDTILLKAAVDKKNINFPTTLATILGCEEDKEVAREREIRLESSERIQLLEPQKRWAKT